METCKVRRDIRFAMKAIVNVGQFESLHIEHEEVVRGIATPEDARSARADVRQRVKQVLEEEVLEARRDLQEQKRREKLERRREEKVNRSGRAPSRGRS